MKGKKGLIERVCGLARLACWAIKQKKMREIGNPSELFRVWLALEKNKFGFEKKRKFEKPVLSVVVGYRDRKGVAVENFLKSLAWQSLPREAYEVIIVDYGSKTRYMEKLCKKIDPKIRYVYTHEKGPLNEARSKNLGARLAKTGLLVFGNNDIIYPFNCLETVYAALNAPYPLLVEARRYNIDKGVVEAWGERCVYEYEAVTRLPSTNYKEHIGGDLHALKKKYYGDILGGYDEAFEGWGLLDPDLRKRAINAGFKTVILNPLTSIGHQEHERLGAGWEEFWRKNEAIYKAKPLKEVKANRGVNAGRWKKTSGKTP